MNCRPVTKEPNVEKDAGMDLSKYREPLAEALTECDDLAFDNMHADWARLSIADGILTSPALAQIVAEAKALAWDEGASSRQCHCFAFSDGECACGNYPGERNPYRETRVIPPASDRGASDV